MLLETTYDLLVVLRKPWICTLCFDAHFRKFRDFWWFLVILIENGHFGPLLRTSNSLLPKSHDISAFNPKDLSGPAQNPVIFDLILTILDPFWGSWGRLRLGSVRAAFGLEDLLRASQTHGTSNFGHFDHFSYWKVNFVILPIRGQWKCHFDPILSPPEPNLWPLAKMCLFRPTAGWTLEGPSGTPNLTLFWPFWTPLRVLEGGCG